MTGTTVQVQNQAGPHKNKWDLSGTVVEVLRFDAYIVKMDGSGRLTKRNWMFLRPILPYKDVLGRGVAVTGAWLCDSRRGRAMPTNALDLVVNKSCAGDTISAAGDSSNTGGGLEGFGAADARTNESCPPIPPASNEVGPVVARESGPTNERPQCLQSTVKQAGSAGQRPQRVSEKPVSKFTRNSTGVLQPWQL